MWEINQGEELKLNILESPVWATLCIYIKWFEMYSSDNCNPLKILSRGSTTLCPCCREVRLMLTTCLTSSPTTGFHSTPSMFLSLGLWTCSPLSLETLFLGTHTTSFLHFPVFHLSVQRSLCLDDSKSKTPLFSHLPSLLYFFCSTCGI